MSAWKSRCSWLRFVKTSAAKRTRSRRCNADACDDASIARRAVAGVEHLAEEPLQVDRLRRRPLDAAALAADPRLDRPDEARPAAGGGEDREEQHRRRRLAVRAGDAGDLRAPRSAARRTRPPRAPSRRARRRRRPAEPRSSSGRSTTSAAAPAASASAAKSCPSTCAPRTQKNAAPGVTARASYARSDSSTGARPTTSTAPTAAARRSRSIIARRV